MAARATDDYREIVVPIHGPAACGEGMTIACRLAADHGATVTLLTVIEVPAEFPLEAQMPAEEDAARRALAAARARAELYGVTVSAPAPATPFAFAEPQVRLAAEGALGAPSFLISPAAGPGRWALVLAGLALAAWVAHRRLSFTY